MSPQGDAAAESPFVKTITADAVCTVLSHVHPRDGFPVIYLCKAIRDLVGQLGEGLWEWWALALWPKTTVAPVVPQMYDTFEALVRDDNRRGETLANLRSGRCSFLVCFVSLSITREYIFTKYKLQPREVGLYRK